MIAIVMLGVATGMRTLTAIAVLCWAAHFGWLPLGGTWAFWMGNMVSVVVFTVLALGEYIGDTLPHTPSRTDWPLLSARLIFGAMVAAAAMAALGEPLAGGILFGLVGAVIGAYGGVRARLFLARQAGRDLPIALAESALALMFSVLAVHLVHLDILRDVHHATMLRLL